MLWRRRKQGDFHAEVEAHLALEIERLKEQGMSEEEARSTARRAFGNVTKAQERFYESSRWRWWDHLGRDVRYSLRMLRKNPGFASIVILTLALGMGVTTAIFSVVDTVLLKPLPFPNAGRLVRVESRIINGGNGTIASYPDFLDWRAQNHVFDGMAAVRTGEFNLVGSRQALHLEGAVVSAQLFSLLGVKPALGRSFLPDEDKPAAANGADPVILSYGLWQREFGSDASVLGRTVRLGDQPFTVVGVMPEGVQYPLQAEAIDLWTTMALDLRGGASSMATQRGAHYLDVVALLNPEVSEKMAQAEMVSITAAMNKQHPENKPRTVRIVSEQIALTGPVRTPLMVLLASVLCVLLIVCANVANLLLARATGRQREMAVRAALGASRRRAVSQLLTESIVLGILGGGLGLGLAVASLSLMVSLIPAGVPRLDAIGLDFRLLSFALLTSLAVGIVFGLFPALQVSKIDLTHSLKEGARGAGGQGAPRDRLRSALVVGEIALAGVLLTGAALLMQSLLRLIRVDPGFEPQRTLTFELDAPDGSAASQAAFYREVVTRISALPGVNSASAVASLPLTGDNINSTFEIEGQPAPVGSRPFSDFNAVEPGYFRTLGIAFVEGRDFSGSDSAQSAPVVIVNRAFARRFFPNADPIGKHVRPGIANGYGLGNFPMREIVGVVEDVKQNGLGVDASPEVYAPLAQSPFNPAFIVARTAGDPRSMVGLARQQVAVLDKNLPLYHVETLDQYYATSVQVPRLMALLLGGFAGLAVLLACLGVYGVISYLVVQRSHEIGVRMALGAEAGEILRWILGRGFRLAVIGAIVGLAGSFAFAHIFSSLLFGVRPTDAITLTGVPLVLLCVAALASYIPARQATKVDPMVALRYE
ncbi:MAG TPA: ABC transporter permease [Terriglobia bacterium]|nr:ABC transporter permease [Terriglobia bacterium]